MKSNKNNSDGLNELSDRRNHSRILYDSTIDVEFDSPETNLTREKAKASYISQGGLTIFKICSKFYNCGLSPPCMQNIFSSIRAQTGMTLKTSENIFHSFKLYFLLPNLADGYIRRRTHKFY